MKITIVYDKSMVSTSDETNTAFSKDLKKNNKWKSTYKL